MKICFKCQVAKPLDSFYRHAMMADGRLNKCKECAKADVTANRNKNLERIRAYDRSRGNRQSPGYLKQHRAKNPLQWKAHIAVNNAVRDGRLARLACETCGCSAVHGHHDDYTKPLEVRWLCAAHHKQHHTNHSPAGGGA